MPMIPTIPSKGFEWMLTKGQGLEAVQIGTPRNADGLTEEQAGALEGLANVLRATDHRRSKDIATLGVVAACTLADFPHTFAKPEPSPTTWEHTGVFMVPMMGQHYESIDSLRSPKLCTGKVKEPRWILKKVAA